MKKVWIAHSQPLLFLVPAAISLAQIQHITPYTGTWQLNLAKSTYQSGMAPRSQTLRFTPEGKNVVSGVGQKDTEYKRAVPWSNGKEVPVEGRKNTTAIQKIQGNTLDMTLKEAGKTVAIVHSVISPDGKSIAGTVTNMDENGNKAQHLEFYERQQASQ